MYGSEAGRKMEGNRIVGAGMNKKVCLISRVEKGTRLSGEGELVHAPGLDGGYVYGGYH